jgi:hypothetical protein
MWEASTNDADESRIKSHCVRERIEEAVSNAGVINTPSSWLVFFWLPNHAPIFALRRSGYRHLLSRGIASVCQPPLSTGGRQVLPHVRLNEVLKHSPFFTNTSPSLAKANAYSCPAARLNQYNVCPKKKGGGVARAKSKRN